MTKPTEFRDQYVRGHTRTRARGTCRRSPELAAKICELVISGLTLNAIARLPETPTYQSMIRWMERDAEFRQRYVQACEKRTASKLEHLRNA